MADPATNGATSNGMDVDMKEAAALDGQTNINGAEAPDMTDPQPPPASAPTALAQAEQPIAPAPAPTPQPSTRPASVAPSRPAQPVAHGGPTRQYLNQRLTPHLLEGMKYIAMNEPEKPLLWLSEFLRDRSKEVEG